MSARQVVFRSAAFLIAGLLSYLMFGIAWYSGSFQPWIYRVLG